MNYLTFNANVGFCLEVSHFGFMLNKQANLKVVIMKYLTFQGC